MNKFSVRKYGWIIRTATYYMTTERVEWDVIWYTWEVVTVLYYCFDILGLFGFSSILSIVIIIRVIKVIIRVITLLLEATVPPTLEAAEVSDDCWGS